MTAEKTKKTAAKAEETKQQTKDSKGEKNVATVILGPEDTVVRRDRTKPVTRREKEGKGGKTKTKGKDKTTTKAKSNPNKKQQEEVKPEREVTQYDRKTVKVGKEKWSLTVHSTNNRGEAKKVAKGVEVKATAVGFVRAVHTGLCDKEGNPLSASKLLRAGGYYLGWTWQQGRAACDKLGIPATDQCCKCQTQDGRGQKAGNDKLYGPVPELSRDAQKELAKLAPTE